jgi:hypothetical protein
MENKTGVSHKRDGIAEITLGTGGNVIGSRRFPGMRVDDKGNVFIPKDEANGAMLAAQSWEVQRDTVMRELKLAMLRLKLKKFIFRLGLLRIELRKKLFFFRINTTRAILNRLERVLSKDDDSRMVAHTVTPNVPVQERAAFGASFLQPGVR